MTYAPLADKRVRQALNYAIDRKRITDTALLGLVGPQDLPWPANSAASEPAKNTMYAFDLDKAKSLLSQAGATNLELDFVYAPTLPEYGTIAEIFQGEGAVEVVGHDLENQSFEHAASKGEGYWVRHFMLDNPTGADCIYCRLFPAHTHEH